MKNRRYFLKTNAALVAGSVLGLNATPAHAENDKPLSAAVVPKEQEPLFRFLQITDQHLTKMLTPYYLRGCERSLWLLNAINEEYFSKIDFVIATGDLIGGGELSAIKDDLDYYDKNFLRQLSVPFYPVMGNHEVCQREGNPEFEAPYRKLFGDDKVDYQFVHKGIHFIIFNDAGCSGCGASPDRVAQRASFVKQALESHPALPKILCCHVPILPVRDDKILAQSFGFGHFHFMKEPEIWQSIEQHKDKVLAILSGHLHLSGTVCVNSVYQIVAAGTSFPHDSVLYTVYKDRIDVEFKNPPSHLWEAYTTFCYGTFRYRQMIKEYSDAEHPEHLTYLTGNPSERRFSIAMK